MLDQRATRQGIVRRVLLIGGVLCLTVFGVIGAVIGNSASSVNKSATAALSIRRADWHGVPLHPEAEFLRVLTPDSSQYTVAGDATTVGGWFKREWTRIGLRFVEMISRNGTTFRFFETSDNIFGYRVFGYAVAETAPGTSTVTLIRLN